MMVVVALLVLMLPLLVVVSARSLVSVMALLKLWLPVVVTLLPRRAAPLTDKLLALMLAAVAVVSCALTATCPKARLPPTAALNLTAPALSLVPVTPMVNPFQTSLLRLFQVSSENDLLKRIVPWGSLQPPTLDELTPASFNWKVPLVATLTKLPPP